MQHCSVPLYHLAPLNVEPTEIVSIDLNSSSNVNAYLVPAIGPGKAWEVGVVVAGGVDVTGGVVVAGGVVVVGGVVTGGVVTGGVVTGLVVTGGVVTGVVTGVVLVGGLFTTGVDGAIDGVVPPTLAPASLPCESAALKYWLDSKREQF